MDADDTETSLDAEGSGYFVSREPRSFGSGKAASRSCLSCFASLLCSKLISSLTLKRRVSAPRPILTFERILDPCLTGSPVDLFYKILSMPMGIVERIEYDPNRSSRIALVRWIERLKNST